MAIRGILRTSLKLVFGLACLAAGLTLFPQIASAQEMLLNRSFESPTAPANGNNFYAAMPNWTTIVVGAAQPQPINIIKTFTGYSGGPTVTPTGGGAQYFDINSRAGTIQQQVTLTAAGLVDYSIYFSTRDGITTVPGMTINIRDSTNAVVSTVSTSFTAADTLYSWKQVGLTNVPLAAGTYTYEVIVPDLANVDLASFVYKPPLQLTKTSTVISDPVNGTTNPKFISGAIVEYVLSVTNPTTSTYTVTGNTINLIDKTPPGLEFSLATIAPGAGPASFSTTNALTTYTFTSLSSTSDNFDMAYDATGTVWTNSPSPAAIASGFDPLITFIRLRVGGTVPAGTTFSYKVQYRLK
ncbi:MAG: hypothetical protein ACKVOJ_02360 [Sphingomonadaceae bacterium]